MSNARSAHKADRATILIAAAKIGCDPRTAENILEHSPTAARNRVHRERAYEVLRELGIGAAESEPPPSGRAA